MFSSKHFISFPETEITCRCMCTRKRETIPNHKCMSTKNCLYMWSHFEKFQTIEEESLRKVYDVFETSQIKAARVIANRDVFLFLPTFAGRQSVSRTEWWKFNWIEAVQRLCPNPEAWSKRHIREFKFAFCSAFKCMWENLSQKLAESKWLTSWKYKHLTVQGLEEVIFGRRDNCPNVSLVSESSEAVLISRKFFLHHLPDAMTKRLRMIVSSVRSP